MRTIARFLLDSGKLLQNANPTVVGAAASGLGIFLLREWIRPLLAELGARSPVGFPLIVVGYIIAFILMWVLFLAAFRIAGAVFQWLGTGLERVETWLPPADLEFTIPIQGQEGPLLIKNCEKDRQLAVHSLYIYGINQEANADGELPIPSEEFSGLYVGLSHLPGRLRKLTWEEGGNCARDELTLQGGATARYRFLQYGEDHLVRLPDLDLGRRAGAGGSGLPKGRYEVTLELRLLMSSRRLPEFIDVCILNTGETFHITKISTS